MSSSATVIQGALGHRGDRYPDGGRKQAPRSPPLVGRPRRLLRAGGTTVIRIVDHPTIARKGVL